MSVDLVCLKEQQIYLFKSLWGCFVILHLWSKFTGISRLKWLISVWGFLLFYNCGLCLPEGTANVHISNQCEVVLLFYNCGFCLPEGAAHVCISNQCEVFLSITVSQVYSKVYGFCFILLSVKFTWRFAVLFGFVTCKVLYSYRTVWANFIWSFTVLFCFNGREVRFDSYGHVWPEDLRVGSVLIGVKFLISIWEIWAKFIWRFMVLFWFNKRGVLYSYLTGLSKITVHPVSDRLARVRLEIKCRKGSEKRKNLRKHISVVRALIICVWLRVCINIYT